MSRNEVLECVTRNVAVSVPTAWFPDVTTVRAFAYLSQLVLNRLHLNFGLARVSFIEDARHGPDHIVLNTPDTALYPKASILVHPKRRSLVVGKATDENVAGLVVSAAVSTRYIVLHPFSSKEKREAQEERAVSMAIELINKDKKRT